MSANNPPKSQYGDPAWEVATLFPVQGQWSEYDYLGLETNRLTEFSNGVLEVLPVPNELHQLIVQFFYRILFGLGSGKSLGQTLVSPFRIRLSPGKFREPDVMFMLEENRERRKSKYWEGADLVVEVANEDDPERDLVTKRAEYAQAGISEYWIVDPRDRSICVLSLERNSAAYIEAGRYSDGQMASSELLKELQVSVNSVFDQGD